MSDVRDFLLTVDKDLVEAQQTVQKTVSKLESKQTNLINVVQSLGEYISDEDVTIRSKAVNYLSLVIGALPPTFLTRQQVQVLCQFFCDRIEDGGAVSGLHKLQGLSRFNNEMAITTFRAMLEHFQDLQIRPQPQRLQILELLYVLMSNHRSAIQSLGDQSLIGILDLVSGEKDPRDLLIIFSVLRVLMIEWDIISHAEILFDSVFCYFPITFRPPPDDPYGITAQDLKVRLRDCISASSYFAPYAFPQLIDKLDSTSPAVKKDVLQTIVACVSSYSMTTISTYSITLWDSLKFEILNVQEEGLAEEALTALRAIAVRLSNSLTTAPDPKTPLAIYLRPITEECNEQLQTPQHKQAKPAGQILSALASASTPTHFLVIESVLPPVLLLYQDADSIVKQKALLEFLAQLLGSTKTLYGADSTRNLPVLDNPLVPFKDRLFEISIGGLMKTGQEETSFQIVAVNCLILLCSMHKYLEENEIGIVVRHLDEIILSERANGRIGLKEAAIKGLVDVSKIKPNLITDITFPAFMARLPDSAILENQDYMFILEGLARVSVEKAISDTLIRRLFNKLDLVLQIVGPVMYPQAILSALHHTLDRRELGADVKLSIYYEKVVELIRKVALGASGRTSLTALNDNSTLEILGRLSNVVVRALDTHKQQVVASQVWKLFCDESEFVPIPLCKGDPTETQSATMIISTYLLAGVKADTLQAQEGSIRFAGSDLHSLLLDLILRTPKVKSPIVRQSIQRQIALIVNKFMHKAESRCATDILWSLIEDDDMSEVKMRTLFWVAKALIMKLEQTNEVLQRLFGLLNDPTYGDTAARGFGLILAPDEIISKPNGAIVRLLAKQKAFNLCVTQIASGFQTAESASRSHFLVALSGMLRYVSTDVLMPEIKTILPLLLQSLDLEDQTVKAATIEILSIVSQESPKVIEEHISSLMSRLLNSATDTKLNVPKVRQYAVRCIKGFPRKITESTLLPYRRAVARGMMTALDDPKRHVRKEAVDCRAAWLDMDELDRDT